jgi:hypothetical protein
VLAGIAVVMGVVLGIAGGGSLSRLAALRLRQEWAIILLFAVQGFSRGRVAGSTAVSAGMIVWIASSVALIVILALNWRLTGMWAVMLGIGSNLFVVLLNSGMPVVLTSVRDLSAASATIATTAGFYKIASPVAIARPLADSLAVNALGSRSFASVGDMLLVVGVTVLIASTMMSMSTAVDVEHD